MEEYLSFREAVGWAVVEMEEFIELLKDKRFPLPVKDKQGKVVFVKSEVKKWLNKNQRGTKRNKKNDN